jgi:cytochrome c556
MRVSASVSEAFNTEGNEMIDSKAKRWPGATLALLLHGALATQITLAQSPTPAEKAIEYRQAVFKIVAGNFGPLARAAQGKAELPPAAVRKYAERLAAIADFARDAFPEVSREGKTRAKPAIWDERPEFEKLLNDLGTNARALATVTAREATPAEFKAAVGAVGNTCKGCHDRFREK